MMDIFKSKKLVINTHTGINNQKIRFGNAKFNFKEIRNRKLDRGYYCDGNDSDEFDTGLSGFHCMMDDWEFNLQLKLENSGDIGELGLILDQLKLEDKLDKTDDPVKMEEEDKKAVELRKKGLSDPKWSVVRLFFVAIYKIRKEKNVKLEN